MSPEPFPTSARSILVLAVGDFGMSAVQYLKRLLPHITLLEDPQTFLDMLATNTFSIAVFATWRPMPAISDEMDARAYRTGTTTCSLVLQDREMVMGPLVIPGASSCWRCWDTRARQADPLAKIQAQKRSFYAEHPESGPYGYLPSLVLLGAAQLANALESLPDTRHLGVALRTDLFTRQVTEETATGFDNCDRCGLQRPLAPRSYAGLQSAFQALRFKAQL